MHVGTAVGKQRGNSVIRKKWDRDRLGRKLVEDPALS